MKVELLLSVCGGFLGALTFNIIETVRKTTKRNRDLGMDPKPTALPDFLPGLYSYTHEGHTIYLRLAYWCHKTDSWFTIDTDAMGISNPDSVVDRPSEGSLRCYGIKPYTVPAPTTEITKTIDKEESTKLDLDF